MSKKFLCLKDGGSWYSDFNPGNLYAEFSQNIVEDDAGITWGVHCLLNDGLLKEVETFEWGGVEWIRHGGGDCPVPFGWKIQVMFGGKSYDTNEPEEFRWSHIGSPADITAYRIISTGEQEGSGAGGGIDLVEQGFEPPDSLSEQYMDFDETPESRMHEWSEVQKRDHRDPSPQEAAYAAKVAAMEPKPEAPKKFPALRDIDYNPCLLGAGQFLKGAE